MPCICERHHQKTGKEHKSDRCLVSVRRSDQGDCTPSHPLIRTTCPSIADYLKWRNRPGCTEDTSRVRVREIHTASGKSIKIRIDNPRRRLQTPDPVAHVIDGEE